MKMNYVLNNNSKKNRGIYSVPFNVVVGLLIIVSLIYIVFPRALPTLFSALVRPFWNVGQNVTMGTTPISELRSAYTELQANNAKNNALQKENDDLKNILGRSTLLHPLLATILKKPPFSAYDTFILDAGSDYNVKKGDRVYTLGDIPIGEIAEVIGNTSKVLLYSSSGQKFTVLMGTSKIEATAMGKGGGYFEASLPRDTKIVAGDTVLVPSLTNSFVGTVEAIASEPSEPFSKVLFRQPVNIYEQRWVLVDTNAETLKTDKNK